MHQRWDLTVDNHDAPKNPKHSTMTIHARTLMRLLTFSLWKAAASSPAPRSTTAFGIHTSSSSSPPRSPGSRLAGVGSSNDDGDDFFDDCSWRLELDGSVSASSIRRKLLRSMLTAETTFRQAVGANAAGEDDGPSALDDHKERFVVRGEVVEIQDPNGYSAVAYIPPSKPSKQSKPSTIEYLPLLVVLHGAGQNRHSALYEFTHFPAASSTSPERDQKNQSDDSPGNHIHLPPYLLSQRNAPSSLSDNFVVVAPYVGKDKRSLYDDPRGNILSFVTWFRDTWMENHSFVDANADANALQTTPPPSPLSSLPPAKIRIPPQKQYLFGFSEGATLAVELATARRFRGAILASYGFRGKLPPLALERLRGIPMWAFHSEGDDVYDVQCSETLVENLLLENAGGAGGDAGGLDAFGMDGVVKFTKLVPSEETTREDAAVGIRGREHVRAALVASRTEEVYSWLLSLP